MDTLTHAFVPYAAYTLARAPRTHRVAAALGAVAPDLDGFWAWLSHVHEYAYPLVHRGFSHTLIGAPLIATALLFGLTRLPWIGRWPRWENLWFSRHTIVPLWIGAWSHLVLDGITITGVPLFWPFSNARFSAEWFFFGVPYLLPVSLVAWIWVWRRKASDRFVRAAFATLVLVLLVAGGVRAYSYPRDLVGDEDVTPGPVEWQWIVSRRNETGVIVYGTRFGGERQDELFLSEANRTQAADAVAACASRPGYVPWRWSLWGLDVVNATAGDEGGWRVVYYDSGEWYADRHPSLRLWRSPARELSDPDFAARCLVEPDGTAHFLRSRGWVGS